MTEKLSKKVHEKIKGDGIEMKSKRYFQIRSWLWLVGSGVLFLLMAFMISLDLYYITSLKPLALLCHKPFLVISGFPYFLFALTTLLLFLTARSYRKSCHMCKHEEWILFSVLIFGAVLIGYTIYFGQFDNIFRKRAEKNRVYQKVVMTSKFFWSHPDSGLLSGVVLAKKDDSTIFIKSWDGSDWKVFVPEKKNIHINTIERKKYIKMIGKKKKEQYFVAWKIWKWR